MVDYELKNTSSDYDGYRKLIALYEQCKDCYLKNINITIEGWFDANLCSVLGGLLSKLELRDNFVSINADDEIKRVLQKNGFLPHYGYNPITDDYHTTIHYLKVEPNDSKYFGNYVHKELLERREMPLMSPNLKKRIKESIMELFDNAKMHSETDYVYACGQFYPTKKKIVFTLVDTGMGFTKSIYRRFEWRVNPIEAIKWSIIKGNTTKDKPGGIGLAAIRRFIGLNHGKLQIITCSGFYEYDADREIDITLSGTFPGSIITAEFKTDDESHYSLNNEM